MDPELELSQRLIERMTAVIGTCDRQMIAMNVCINKDGKKKCQAEIKSYMRCGLRKEQRVGAIQEGCAEAFSGYEDCMAERGKPSACMVPLEALLSCATLKVAADKAARKAARTDGGAAAAEQGQVRL